jgi:hypothetical protein
MALPPQPTLNASAWQLRFPPTGGYPTHHDQKPEGRVEFHEFSVMLTELRSPMRRGMLLRQTVGTLLAVMWSAPRSLNAMNATSNKFYGQIRRHPNAPGGT